MQAHSYKTKNNGSDERRKPEREGPGITRLDRLTLYEIKLRRLGLFPAKPAIGMWNRASHNFGWNGGLT